MSMSNAPMGKNSPNWKGYWASRRTVPTDVVPLSMISAFHAGETEIGVKGPKSRWTHLGVGNKTACGHEISARARAVAWTPQPGVACRTCLARWDDTQMFAMIDPDVQSA